MNRVETIADHWTSPWKNRIRLFADLVFPRSCVLCLSPIMEPNHESICVDCELRIKPIDSGCLKCGAPIRMELLSSSKLPKSCRHCEKRKWSFRRAHCYVPYRGTASKAVKKMKQAANETLAIELGNCFGRWLASRESFDLKKFECLIPIPQHWIRRVSQRYNQAEVLAECISRELRLPIERKLLHRTRWTEKQGVKSLQNRLKDVRDSFACNPASSIVGSTILLVDDVVTSGATAHDASRALKKAGAKCVEVAAFARAVGPSGYSIKADA